MRWRRHPRCRCADCGTATVRRSSWEWYMVHNHVWRSVVDGHGFLCVGCLESRLGRVLSSADFTDYPVNMPNPWDTPRLADRKSRPPVGGAP